MQRSSCKIRLIKNCWSWSFQGAEKQYVSLSIQPVIIERRDYVYRNLPHCLGVPELWQNLWWRRRGRCDQALSMVPASWRLRCSGAGGRTESGASLSEPWLHPGPSARRVHSRQNLTAQVRGARLDGPGAPCLWWFPYGWESAGNVVRDVLGKAVSRLKSGDSRQAISFPGGNSMWSVNEILYRRL